VFTTNQTSLPANQTSQTAQASSQPRPTNTVPSTLAAHPSQPPSQPHGASVTRGPVPETVSSALRASMQPLTSTVTAAPSSYVFQVTAIQIRLGAKKFKPLTAVTFKDDGVLFTLTGMNCVDYCAI